MYLLLDIDGVMVPIHSWKKPDVLQDGFPVFSNQSIQALNKILDHTGATVILTTSHKYSYTLYQWRAIFRLRGIHLNNIDRLPHNVHHLSRKDEIMGWYQNNGRFYDQLIIIDDDKSLNALPPQLKKNLVMTSSMLGLNGELADDALLILEKQMLMPA